MISGYAQNVYVEGACKRISQIPCERNDHGVWMLHQFIGGNNHRIRTTLRGCFILESTISIGMAQYRSVKHLISWTTMTKGNASIKGSLMDRITTGYTCYGYKNKGC